MVGWRCRRVRAGLLCGQGAVQRVQVRSPQAVAAAVRRHDGYSVPRQARGLPRRIRRRGPLRKRRSGLCRDRAEGRPFLRGKPGLTPGCFFCELQKRSFDRLQTVVHQYLARGVRAHTHRGEVNGVLDQVVERAVREPLFLFLDPCGLVLPQDRRVDVLARKKPAYQQILTVFADIRRPMRARDLCQALDLLTVPKNTEGIRSELKRLVARGIFTEPEPGLFAPPSA